MSAAPRVVIVGGGATGLSAAFALTQESTALGTALDITLLEAGGVGGHAQTLEDDGFLVESGPNGFLSREPETLSLLRALGLESRLIEARPEAKRRFIVRKGKLCRAPESPPTLLATDALSLRGKIRLLGEPFARRATPGGDETVYDFACRRIGREAAEMLVDAAVSGISAGDSRALSVAAQFPQMVEMEREHGSLMRAMFARRKQGKGPSKLLSFDRGLHTLIQGLAGRLGRTVRAQAGVTSLDRTPSHWLVRTDRGEAHAADHVVLAVSARAASAIVAGLDPALAASLAAIPFSGIHVVALGYRIADVPHPLDGYGYLVTRPERMATLGVVWESSLFPGRAPEGMALLRVFLGGSRRPELAGAAARTAIAAARADLELVLGITAAPVRTWSFPWPNAIAQYTVGHLGRVAAIRDRLQQHSGLTVCGTSYDGTSFNHAIAAGSRAGRDLAAALANGAAADQRQRSSVDRRGPHTPPGEPALAYS